MAQKMYVFTTIIAKNCISLQPRINIEDRLIDCRYGRKSGEYVRNGSIADDVVSSYSVVATIHTVLSTEFEE